MGSLELMRVASNEQFDSELLGLVLECLFVAPRDYLMSMHHSYLYPTELEYLHKLARTLSSGNSASASSSQSPFTKWKVGARDLHQSNTQRLPMLPVQNTADTLLGVIISLYLLGTSNALSGTWKSPTTRASCPISSSSAMLILIISLQSNQNHATIAQYLKMILGRGGVGVVGLQLVCMSQNQKWKGKGKGCICYYNVLMVVFQSQQIQQEHSQKKQHFSEKMPMLSREQSSSIKFRNIEHSNKQPIYEILNDLYENHNSPSRIYGLLSTKRINPVIQGSDERDDLEYFIPQIITYMVIEKNLADEELTTFIIQACITDFYFAHRVYFYLNSLSEDHLSRKIGNVWEFVNTRFMERMQIYSQCRLSGIEFTRSMIQMDSEFTNKRKVSDQINELQQEKLQASKDINNTRNPKESHRFIFKYGTRFYPNPAPLSPPVIKVPNRKKYCDHGFMQTPQFWDDLIEVGNKISKVVVGERNDRLVEYIQEINEKLPANVYIPFFKDEIRLYTVLCVWKGRLFATKMRAPFSIWVEIYREAEELNLSKVEEIDEEESTTSKRQKKKKNILEKIYETISKPFSIKSEKNTLNIKKIDNERLSPIAESLISSKPHIKQPRKSRKPFSSFTNERLSISSVYEQERDQNESKSERLSNSVSSINEQPQTELCLDDFFGPNADLHIQEVRSKSVYRELKSWKLIHLMVKTGDDIKQEQFAMQLINRFQYIFKKEKLDCVVFPYEVISLGPDCGVIQMLNNVITLNSLFQKLRAKEISLSQLFRKAFPSPDLARKNFMRSLAGYSILTYFLQVKDRHNGNILLNREGYIIHIDFGFFLSNAPGKGVELEKKCPFKLISQYIEVIGGFNSEEFFEFRRLFYKGFSAILKHKQSIITLVKMMYSSHGQSMGCFIKGEEAIEQLQRRFSIGQGVQSFCYDLINSSIDNWRARWYDKFQYFLQKIYY